MIFRIADNPNLPAVGSYHITLGDSFLGVVRAFRVHVGSERQQLLGHRRFSKNRNQIYRLERSDQLGALAFAQHRPPGALESGELGV